MSEICDKFASFSQILANFVVKFDATKIKSWPPWQVQGFLIQSNIGGPCLTSPGMLENQLFRLVSF